MSKGSVRRSIYTIPNILTMLRILAIPIIVLVYYLPFEWKYLAAAGLFAGAAFTDWLDGYLARKWEQSSALGAFLDPVADKLMVAVALVLLVESHASAWLAIPALVIISREITISALREWMAEVGKRASVSVSNIGKVKTFAQMTAITGLLARQPSFEDPIVVLAYGVLYIATGLTLWSMIIYLRAAWPILKEA
ncbi:CDP-diacylglycerol--glycerol-3-phosphate 3-phosphatidyltransferase [Gammaproteobacteria bacterium 42_54_T18]|mgnify:CR=1 FL=1|nr:CDP-diacylglycerol--glycerol-3-phosphate 3-phosphatidyltransferase [Gammaproteobacteria bacterium 42_54_T18]